MTQQKAMNMSNEQAAQILIPMRNMMCDENGCPISDAVFALDMAIEALEAQQELVDATNEIYAKGYNAAKREIALSGEYERAYHRGKVDATKWIPVSERLPDKDGEYLVCPSDGILEDYSDFSDVMIMPYDEGCEAFGWWTDRFDNVSLGYIDSDFDKFDVIAWQPLPEPYKESEDI